MKCIDYALNSDSFRNRLRSFKNNGDTRALPDLAEEFLVEQFGELFGSRYVNWFNTNGFSEIEDFAHEALKTVFEGTVNDVTIPENATLEQVLLRLGSRFFSVAGTELNSFGETIKVRKYTNKIKELIKNGVIKEECQ